MRSFLYLRKRITKIFESLFVCAALLTAAVPACASQPQCDKPGQWPSNMAFVHLKNGGFTSNDKIDFSKTKVSRIASEKISDTTYRQVHHVIFTETDGGTIETITISDATIDECSMGEVDVYRVEKVSP
jgi:hypothetical protein